MSAIGVLGEDLTDVDTLKVLMRRLLPSGIGVQGRYPPKGGCSALRRHAAAYMRELQSAGCTALALVHDLDLDPANCQLRDEGKLRKELCSIRVPSGVTCHICIPVEEIEAWFWSDPNLISIVGKGGGKAHSSPHLIRRPKEELIRLSFRAHRKPVYSTNKNPELAAKLNLDLCAERCPSFRQLREFLISIR